MYTFGIIISAFIVLNVSAGYLPSKEFISLKSADQSVGASYIFSSKAFSSYGGSYADENGATLTSLAHSSAIEAKNAVHNQDGAGSQAEYDAKNNLASLASGAAKTAQAVLIGKQALLTSIKRQLIDAKNQLQQEISQYQQTREASAGAQDAAHQAQEQLHALAAALTKAQANAQQTSDAAAGAANAEAAQKAMVYEAKQKVVNLINQLKHAYGDVKETEASAAKSAHAAHIAQSNAAASASKISHLSPYAKWF